ncbi:hypothetical protein K4F52_000426 [Lecanicillium sp. MT-2017a]|nr:hypothetical protein K4F52_000426 [Lecanicillium sp. MT-2017a]
MLHRGKEAGQAASLLLVCRQVYHEVLPILYGENTFSFFGPGIVPFLVRNVGAEGLAMVRNVHLALPLDATRWMQSRWKREVTKAIKCIKENFTALKQFDVEIILTWGQPKQPDLLWKWLMVDVFAQLGGLDEFVLKIAVARPLSKHKDDRYEYQDWQPETEPLSSWSDEDYQRLKLAVTAERSSSTTVE